MSAECWRRAKRSLREDRERAGSAPAESASAEDREVCGMGLRDGPNSGRIVSIRNEK